MASALSAFENAMAKGETGSGSRSLMSDAPKNVLRIAGSESANVSTPQTRNSMSKTTSSSPNAPTTL